MQGSSNLIYSLSFYAMTTPSSNQFGQNMSSPFLGVVPRTPAMYQRFTFASESPAAAVPQLYIVAKSPEYDRGMLTCTYDCCTYFQSITKSVQSFLVVTFKTF